MPYWSESHKKLLYWAANRVWPLLKGGHGVKYGITRDELVNMGYDYIKHVPEAALKRVKGTNIIQGMIRSALRQGRQSIKAYRLGIPLPISLDCMDENCEPQDNMPGPLELLITKEQVEFLLKQLNSTDRQLVAEWMSGDTFEEIGLRRHVTRMAVHQKMHRIFRKLRESGNTE